MPDVAIYAVPNNGGWYDFGYFVGIVFLGVGARKSAAEVNEARRPAPEPATPETRRDEERS